MKDSARWVARLSAALVVCIATGALAQIPPALQAKADRGDAAAQYEVGDRYMRGMRVPKEVRAGMAWLQKSAEQGYTDAETALGVYSVTEHDDFGGAAKWFRKAAQKLNEDAGVVAARYLGWMYANGHGVPRDYVEAAGWYRKAAERRDSAALYGLAWMEFEIGGPAKFADTIKPFVTTAKQDALARYALIYIYAEGINTPPDAREAVYWLRGKGWDEAEGAFRLGELYDFGLPMSNGREQLLEHVLRHRGVKPEDVRKVLAQRGKDHGRALAWYRKGAEAGHVGAQVNLARLYADPDGPSWNCAEAVKWIKAATDKSDATAMLNMGRLYVAGPDRIDVRVGLVMDERPDGFRVVEVARDSSAERAGMKTRDLIVEFEGLSTLSPPPVELKVDRDWMRRFAEAANQPPTHIDMKGLIKAVNASPGRPLRFGVRREGADGLLRFEVTPIQVVRKCPGAEASGVRRDMAEAVKWFEKAGEKGNTEGLFWAAEAYRKGTDVPKDSRRAFSLYEKGAALGDWQAAQEIARMYSSGDGVEKNRDLSDKWFRKAIDLKHRSLR